MNIPNFRDDNVSVIVNEQYFYNHIELTLPYLVILCLIATLGTFGNALVITAVLTNKNLRTVANMFIVNLAVADMCITTFVDAFSIIGIRKGEVYFKDKWFLCYFVSMVCLISCISSLLSIGGISFNRCIHICYYGIYSRLFSRTKATCFVAFLWIIGFLVGMPTFFGFGDMTYDRKTLSCIWDRTHSLRYTLFVLLVAVFIPWLLTAACYVKIFLFVRSSMRRVQTFTDEMPSCTDREKSDSLKLSKTLFIIFIVFTVCWMPYGVVTVSDVEDVYSSSVHTRAVLLAHTNSSLNFIVYGVSNRQFRNAYARVLNKIFVHRRKIAHSDRKPTKRRTESRNRENYDETVDVYTLPKTNSPPI